MKKVLTVVTLVLLVACPLVAFAVQTPAELLSGSGGGLVPQCEGPFCRACDLIELSSNVINFAIAFSVIIATLMFAYAGILYVTAASKPDQVKKAHGVFVNVFVGLCIVLTAWLLVNITFSVLTGKGLAIWSDIACVERPTSAAFPDAPAVVPGNRTPAGIGRSTYSPAGGRCAVIQSGPCSPSNLAQYFGASNAANMSTICHMESGGNPLTRSGSDKLWYGGQSFSMGLFQINLIGSQIYCPNRAPLNCGAAFSPPANPNETRPNTFNPYAGTRLRATSGWGYTVRNTALYNQCVTAATDVSCNLLTAQKRFEAGRGQYGHYQAWYPDVIACNLSH